MDGVIVNFVDAWLRVFNIKNPYINGQNIDKSLTDIYPVDEKTKYNLPSEFWEDMEWTYNGVEILNTLENLYGKDNIFILSSPGRFKYAPTGKMQWIRKNIPDYEKRTLLGKCKYACASHNSILVDDTWYILKEFINEGGYGIQIPRPWNELWNKENDTINMIKNAYEAIQ